MAVFSGLVVWLAMVWANVTVEPSEFVTTLARRLSDIPLTELLIYKVCINKFNYTENICENLLAEENEEYNQAVQYEFTKYNIIISSLRAVLPTVAGLYYGAWCDIFGRKFLMAVYWVAQFTGIIILQVNAYWKNGPPELYILHILPVAIIGGDAAFWVARTLFLSDIIPPEKRAFRFSLLFLCSSVASPIGTFLGTYIYTQFGIVVCLTSSLVVQVLGVIFMFWKIRDFKYTPEVEKRKSCGTIFDPKLMTDTLKTAFRKRPGPARFIIFFLAVACFFLYAPGTGEAVIDYVLLRDRFKWGPTDMATFGAAMQIWILIVQIVVNPVLKKVRINEVKVLMVFALVRVVSDIMVFFANEPWLMYLARGVDTTSLYGHFIVASLFSSCAPAEELGRVNAIITLSDNLNPLIFGPIYREVYEATSETLLGAPYLISAASGVVFILMMFYMLYLMKGKPLAEITGNVDPSRPSGKEEELEERNAMEMSEEERKHIDTYSRITLSMQGSVRFKTLERTRITTDM